MAHLLEDHKDISVLKAYWVNHAIDQNVRNVEYGGNTNKRQTCVGVYGVDIHPDGSRFATCGADQKIKIWSMAPIINVNVEVSECVDKLLCVCKYDQTSNQNTNIQTFNNTIHCVKWSNNGTYLASGAADGIVSIWKLSNQNNNNNNNNHNHNPIINHNHNHNNNNQFLAKNTNKNIESWLIAQQLTKHRDEANASNTTLTTDVQDIVWSPDDRQLISAGSDHNIIIWNKTNNNHHHIFQCMQIIKSAHDDIILGLSFDPIGDFLLSQSADGSAKIWSVQNGYTMHQKITSQFKKRSHFIRKNANDDLTRLDVCQRGSWSPDGLHLLTSFGVTQDNIFISPIYQRENFSNQHSFVGHCKPTTVSKWNPRIYQSSHDKTEMFHVAAVGSMDRKLSIWSTNAKKPMIVFTEIGKESVLDISWSRSGDILMASTHDGNVMVFIFGKHVFGGHKLSINDHVAYVDHCYDGLLHENIQKNIRRNITLCNEFRFNQIKPRQLVQPIVSGQVMDEDIQDNEDKKMDQESNCSEFIPSESAFGPCEEEEEKVEEINLNLNFQKNIKFNAIEGKQRALVNITDYYATQREKHSNSNMMNNEYASLSPLYNNNASNNNNNNNNNNSNNNINNNKKKKINETLSIRKKKVKKKKEKRKREKDKEDNNNNNEPRKKKRKYNDKLIKIDHNEKIMFEITFHNDKERGIFKISGVNKEKENSKERVCEFKQFVVINGNERLLWKTEIPSFITQCVCNEKWTICGSSDGELYCFDNNGILVIAPIQIEEEIVFLFLTKVFTQNLIENEDIYLLIITNDCTLRQWKLNKKMNGFEPTQIFQTNISNLLLKNKKNKKEISLKNGFITNTGKIILTLSNGYIFTYKQSLNCWLRICDDKYSLSNQRILSINHHNRNNNHNNNGNEIGKLSLKFSELLTAMNNNSKSMIENPNNNNNKNNNINMELSSIHTISHLEQELITLSLFKNKEIEFENIIKKYIHELLNALAFKKLSFMVVNKINKIFNCLLHTTNNWSGSVFSQRKLLYSLIQIVNQKNNDPQKEYHVKLQQLTNKYTQALNACSNDII